MKKKQLPSYEEGGLAALAGIIPGLMGAFNQGPKAPGSGGELQGVSSALGAAGSIASLLPGAGTAVGAGLSALSSLSSNINIPSNYVPMGENQGKYSRANGGYLNPMSSNTQQVVGNNPSLTDGVTLPTARVDHGETISKTNMGPYVFSNKLVNPLSGNTFAKDDKKLASGDKAAESKYEDPHAKNTLKYHTQQRERLAKLNDVLAMLVDDGKGFKEKMAKGGKLPGYQNGGNPEYDRSGLSPRTRNLNNDQIAALRQVYLHAKENKDFSTLAPYQKQYNLDFRDLEAIGGLSEIQNNSPTQTSLNNAISTASGPYTQPMVDPSTGQYISSSPQTTSPYPSSNQLGQAMGDVMTQGMLAVGSKWNPRYADPAGVFPQQGQQVSSVNNLANTTPEGYPTPMAPPGIPNPVAPTTGSPQKTKTAAPAQPQTQPQTQPQPVQGLAGLTGLANILGKIGVSQPIPGLPLGQVTSQNPTNFQSLQNNTSSGPTLPRTGGPYDDKIGGDTGLRGWYNNMSDGERLQLGEFAGKAGMLLRGADKQALYQNNAPITKQQYDPQNALMQQQYAANAARQGLQNSGSGASLQSNLQGLAANQMRAGAQTITQYDQMNKQAESQYQQKLGQRQQENLGYKYAVDQIRQQDQAAYWNQYRDVLTGVGNYGREKVAVDENQKSVELLLKAYPDLEKWTKQWVGTKTNG